MTKYELACDKRVTLAAIILEVLMVVACVLMADAAVEHFFGIQTMIESHVSLKTSVIAVLILQYLIVATELIARNRDDRRGFTLPLVFLPGGIIVRTLLMAVSEVVVISIKLVMYFISVLLSFVFQIFRIDKIMGTAHLVDITDFLLEPLEIGVNKMYNALYFHKIKANSSVFTSIFNGSLSFWCINH